MPTFKHNLLGIGRLCNHGYTVLFDINAVTVYSKNNKTILLKGWRDTTGAKLWRFYLRPEDNPVSSVQPTPQQSQLPSTPTTSPALEPFSAISTQPLDSQSNSLG